MDQIIIGDTVVNLTESRVSNGENVSTITTTQVSFIRALIDSQQPLTAAEILKRIYDYGDQLSPGTIHTTYKRLCRLIPGFEAVFIKTGTNRLPIYKYQSTTSEEG